jgi:competence protein ComEC
MMWLSIGFGLSCGLCAGFLNQKWLIPASLAALCACVIMAAVGGTRKLPRKIAWTLLGCGLGFGWILLFHSIYLRSAVSVNDQSLDVVITATDYSWETNWGIAGDGTLDLDGKTYRVRYYVNDDKTVVPGDQLAGSFRFRFTAPDGAGESTHHKGEGIFLLAYQKGNVEISAASVRNLRIFAAELSRSIREILKASFPADAYPFAKALLLGDTTDLDYETDAVLKTSGIRHVVAVSGLHVSILYALLRALTLKRRYLTALLGVPVLILFAATAGFSPSVTRACIMVGLMMIAAVVNKEYDGPTELSFAALAMLLMNPLVITSVCFQLSVASVAGIFLFQPRLRAWMRDSFEKRNGNRFVAAGIRWLLDSVAVTLSATSLTTPLCAWYFGMVSLVGILTNLLTLWAVSLIFCGIMGVCILYLLTPEGAAFLAQGISWLIRYVLHAAKLLSKFPLAAVYADSVYIVLWLIFLYVLLGIFLVMHRKKPAVLVCCALLGLCVALHCSWAEPATDECRVTVLDVGQGQCILIQNEGKTFLVDCGGDYSETAADIAASKLLSQGISHLDGVIVTHYDADHAGGIPLLLTRIRADLVFLPETPVDGASAAIAAATSGQVIRVWDDQTVAFGNTEISIFGPVYSGSSNENSLAILFETENCAILITGDRSAFGERMLMRNRNLPDVDLLIAGHHGSRYSTSDELLTAVRPETVIISVGENTYGHPSQEVLDRLAEFGCAVYRTDRDGTIIYRR